MNETKTSTCALCRDDLAVLKKYGEESVRILSSIEGRMNELNEPMQSVASEIRLLRESLVAPATSKTWLIVVFVAFALTLIAAFKFEKIDKMNLSPNNFTVEGHQHAS